MVLFWPYVLLLLLAMTSCAEQKFHRVLPSAKNQAEVEDPRSLGEEQAVIVSCEDEFSGQMKQPLSLEKNKAVSFVGQVRCHGLSSDAGKSRELVISIVLDRSTSMRDSYGTIHHSLKDVVYRLQKNGIKTLIGAVGFVDDIFGDIAPMNPQSFLQRFGAWGIVEEPNGKWQESGLQALERAASQLVIHREKRLAIVYVTDTLAYRSRHNVDNFTTGQTATYFRKLGINPILISSVPSNMVKVGRLGNAQSRIGEITPKQQVNKLRMEAGIPGYDLDFPLSHTNFLDQLTVGEQLATQQSNSSCKRKQMRAFDAQRNVLASTSSETLQVSASQMKDFGFLEIERCCGLVCFQKVVFF